MTMKLSSLKGNKTETPGDPQLEFLNRLVVGSRTLRFVLSFTFETILVTNEH